MKILQIITLSDLGGAQSVVTELSNALIEKNNEVIVMSSSDGEMWTNLNDKIIQIKCLSFCRNISLFKEVKSYYAIKRAIKKNKPDVIHLHSSKIGVLGRLAAFPFFTKKVIYTVHGFDTILKANRVFLPLEKILKKFCKKIIAVSNYDKQNLLEQNIKNVEVIYNAISEHRIESKEIKPDILPSNGQPIIGSIARLAPPKRFDLFCELAINNKYFNFVWIGNKDKVENLPDNCFCLGEVNNAAMYIKYFDIFVLLSDYEGLPMSIIEALACGKPVLASNVGGISELLNNGEGYSLENNIQLFVEKISFLLQNKKKYKNMSQLARERYEKDFTVEKMVNEYLKVYEE